MAKLYIPFIKRSVSPQFYTIFGELNIWRKFDRRVPYKNSENFVLSQIVLEKYFLAKLFVPVISRNVSPQFYAIFGRLNFWRKFDRRGPYKNSKNLALYQIVLRKYFLAKLFWKIEFLKEILQALTLQKLWKFCTISNSAREIFFGKIICACHLEKCFSTILGNFWKIEFLTEIQQALT